MRSSRVRVMKYRCEVCGKIVTVSDKKVPKCCGKPMMPMDLCLQPAHAEHARPMDKEDACDDGFIK